MHSLDLQRQERLHGDGQHKGVLGRLAGLECPQNQLGRICIRRNAVGGTYAARNEKRVLRKQLCPEVMSKREQIDAGSSLRSMEQSTRVLGEMRTGWGHGPTAPIPGVRSDRPRTFTAFSRFEPLNVQRKFGATEFYISLEFAGKDTNNRDTFMVYYTGKTQAPVMRSRAHHSQKRGEKSCH
jgi:hypothetical protein